MLLALTAADRSSELAALDLRFRRFYPEGVVFNLPSLTKSVKVGKQLKESFHARFLEDKSLCAVECLLEYEQRTKSMTVNIAGEANKLFLAVVKPNHPVSSSTIARWVRTLLHNAVIDTSVFKPHSVRGASTSAAARSGMPISDVMAMACWSSDTTFKRFYYKPVLRPDACRAVLSKGKL